MTVTFSTNTLSATQRLLLAAFAVLFLIGLVPFAQAQGQDDVLKTETSLVQLNVGVVDRQGRAITSLTSSDFVVYEDDVKRPIVAFEPTQAPFSLVMLLDMSGSTVNFRQQIQQAAVRFLTRWRRKIGSRCFLLMARAFTSFTVSARIVIAPLTRSSICPMEQETLCFMTG